MDTISLLAEIFIDDPGLFELEVELGVYDFSAASICAGVIETLVDVSVANEEGVRETASIAPRSTSNKTRTSPVMAATFFVSSSIADWGNSFFTSSCESELRRFIRMVWSWVGEYGAKCTVTMLQADEESNGRDVEDDVKVCVFAIPIIRRDVG